mmetsp:Transcript_19718/g.34714  ORF Transcript_19718/g.34714 Transcript_19718/m.34714 type:complete len:559 (-) Transcript_19718:307-1983(-)|eukprot:CAMPEP_0201925512 /NCGR_PEP_ID=MMETSP0903-20130614/14738_1 /ASSEMBLY_ACC=CAM_ASM_000552 /TAXON_ID=420261 /ORGANISM="Thalassiosira antarctica, Strain CCMP982" /LENGTH=558 /DNA_ID=CAMNT_0048463199 /DNA_START=80 /DNA_END=1756 /DNA_ORIENTATION=-
MPTSKAKNAAKQSGVTGEKSKQRKGNVNARRGKATAKTSKNNHDWTPDEETKLRKLVATGKPWDVIASRMPGKTDTQCRERWQTRFTSKQWTIAEDETIDRLQEQWGNKWSKIAGELEGRTDNDVKNRSNSRKRSRERKAVRLMDLQEEMKAGDLAMGKDSQSAGILAENNVKGGKGKDEDPEEGDAVKSSNHDVSKNVDDITFPSSSPITKRPSNESNNNSTTRTKRISASDGMSPAKKRKNDSGKSVFDVIHASSVPITSAPSKKKHMNDPKVNNTDDLSSTLSKNGLMCQPSTQNEQNFQTTGSIANDIDPPSIDWIAQIADTVKHECTQLKQYYELQLQARKTSGEEIRKEKEEHRQEEVRLGDELNTEKETNVIKDAKISSMKQEIEGLKMKLNSEKESNKENAARIVNMKGSQSELQAKVDEQGDEIEGLKEELAREKKAYAEKINRMKSIVENQKNSFNSAGASQQIMNKQLEVELQRAKDKMQTQQQSNGEQKQRMKELEYEIETTVEGHNVETEKSEKQHSRLLSKMACAHEEEVKALNEELESLRSML